MNGLWDAREHCPRLLSVFARWRLLAYGYTFPVFYAAFFLYLYKHGLWLLDAKGAPVYHDFTRFWMIGLQALHGESALLHAPTAFVEVYRTSGGLGHSPNIIPPYPPTLLLILGPLAMLPYVPAFLIWELVTLGGCLAVVFGIVRRQPAIALVLASPFTAWNFLIGQNGFLTASLLGASLLFLERWPVLAGVFIGCLTYKPQFGLLIPVALIAGNHWRVTASAAGTSAVLVGVSVAVFGTDPWVAFPQGLFTEAGETVFSADDRWGLLLQSMYGLTRVLHGGAVLAWLVQCGAATGLTVVIWFLWRSPVRYPLNAAALSAATFLVTPYVFAYDLAGIAIPVAFLAKDQLRCGVRRGEQTILLGLFTASLPILFTAGRAPFGAIILVTLLSLILRRGICERREVAQHLETLRA